MAVDCLAGYLYTCQQEGTTPPSPSPLEAVSLPAITSELGLEGVEENGFINIVTVDVAEYAKVHFEKSVKKTLTIPASVSYTHLPFIASVSCYLFLIPSADRTVIVL